MTKIISPCLNASNDDIKSEALRLLGTAVQSNPKVQMKALERDFIKKLLHILVINIKVKVQSRCLFALNALIRQFPIAQKALIDHGGLEIFGKILKDSHPQTQRRVMNLMSDLAVERTNLNEIEDDHVRKRKISEYDNTQFKKKLLSYNYCRHLSDLMIKSFSKDAFDDSNIEDYDFLTIILDSMNKFGVICKINFRVEKHAIIPILKEQLRHYKSVRDSTSTKDDYSLDQIILLLENLSRTVFAEHDEL